jgi:FkbM family methyltransferase
MIEPVTELRKAKRYLRLFGSRMGLKVLAAENSSRSTREVSVTHPSVRHPFILRTRSSDIDTYDQVIYGREYDMPGFGNVSTIVDAGANIGLASVFFAHKFPNARIIALEPESSNFDLLSRNLRAYPNVTCLKKALWNQSGSITVFDPGDGHWGFRTDGDGEPDETLGKAVGKVDCISLPDLLDQFGIAKLDVLKIDIEGSEKEVFDASANWIDRVDVIVAELHDRFKRGCSRAFYNATAGFAREVHKGENIYAFRNA